MMKQEEDVLLAVVNGKLAAVKVIESASLGCQQETHEQRDHQDVQFLILIDRAHRSLLKVESLDVFVEVRILLMVDAVRYFRF